MIKQGEYEVRLMPTSLSVITCKRCGEKVSDQYSYCTNCQAPLTKEAKALETRIGRPPKVRKWFLSPLDTKRKPKHQLPNATRQGILVGAMVGAIDGVVNTVVFYFAYFPLIMDALTKQLTSRYATIIPKALSMVDTIFRVSILIAAPLIGALLGCVLGFLFVTFRKRIPGRSIVRKSLFVATILVALPSLNLLHSLLDPAARFVLGIDFLPLQLEGFTMVVIMYPLLGYLFGYLLQRRLK